MNNKGFTFIELLISLTVLAVAILPLLNMYSTSLQQAGFTSDLTTARYLAQEGMEKMKNLNYSVEQLKRLGSTWEPPLHQPAWDINGEQWRVLKKIAATGSPLEVHVQVFKEHDILAMKDAAEPIVDITTLLEDFDWSFTQ